MGATISAIMPHAMGTVVVDAEVDLVVGLVEAGIPGRSLSDINFRQPFSGAPQTFWDWMHPEIGVKARTLAMGVVRHLKAGLPVSELLNKLGIPGRRAAGLQRGAGSARRPHLQTIRATESAAIVMLSTGVAGFVEHPATARFAMKVQAAPVGAAGATVPLVCIDRTVLREFIIERHSPLLAAGWGYAVRLSAVASRAGGAQE